MRGDQRLAGAVGVAVALGSSELLAGLVEALPSLLEGVGDLVVATVPPAVKDWAIASFGVYDKAVLVAGMVVVAVALGAAVGGGRAGPAVFAAFAAAAFLANVAGGSPPGPTLLAAGAAGGAGILTLAYLRPGTESETDPQRRRFLVQAAGLAASAVVAAGTGRLISARLGAFAAGREGVALPPPVTPARAVTASMAFPVEGITRLITPNEEFFRIDTALSVPRLDPERWQLSIHGMVERPFSLSYAELLEMEMVERYITLSCVSNEVGGSLIGTASWQGVPLSTLLERAGMSPDATQVVGRSVDRFTVGFPTEVAFDGRDALVAVGMNGEPLPFAHGFPARLVVAGLYGYVSATKWLAEIELTTWDGFDAYWVPRGWSKLGPVKTQSRIDIPRHGSVLAASPRAIAGVAWAPNLGIDRVEVQIDDGPWQDAELAEPLDRNTWRQWRLAWDPTAGDHLIRVRATDASGYTQTGVVSRPAPDGATGWHTIAVRVA